MIVGTTRIRKQIMLSALLVPLSVFVACTAGCHSSEDTSNGVSVPKPTAQSRAESAAAVQSNPNIPPEAKAHISAQIQGKTSSPAGAAHP